MMGAFEDAWNEFEGTVGPVLQQALSDKAPVVTGQLSESMTWEDQEGVLTAGSKDDRGPIAAYVTRGTAPHPIEPVNAEFLHFFASDGTEVFTKHVDHPGTSANPFHVDAWESVRDEVLAEFRTIVGDGVTLAYLNPWRDRTIEVTDL